ncbi:unnamed protein product [Effrenium voratum]|nr:unnamed protein product [Effrenium voratum]
MGRVHKVTGEDVMREDDFAAWWEEHHQEGGIFINELRRHLARLLQVKNFRQLALACGDEILLPDSDWRDGEMLVLIRPYVTDKDGEGLELLQAARDGDAASVARLLEDPQNPDLADRFTNTALHWAAEGGHPEVARCLLEVGAELDKENGHGFTPLHFARCLLEVGAELDKENGHGFTPLHLAAARGHVQVAGCLLQAGADKDKARTDGVTPLHMAAMNRHSEIVRCLLEAGADRQCCYQEHVNKADVSGAMPTDCSKTQANRGRFAGELPGDLSSQEFAWPSRAVLGSLTVNALIGTNLSDVLWAYALQLTTPLTATLGLSLTVPFGMISDVVLRGRSFGLQYISGSLLVLVGFLLVSFAPQMWSRLRINTCETSEA